MSDKTQNGAQNAPRFFLQNGRKFAERKFSQNAERRRTGGGEEVQRGSRLMPVSDMMQSGFQYHVNTR